MTAQKLLLKVLDRRHVKYRDAWKRCKEKFSREVVHSLRVDARRLLALIDLLRAVVPDPILKKLRRQIKNQLDQFDELRDTQTMLTEISARLKTLPMLMPLQKELKKREKQLLKRARRQVRGFEKDVIEDYIKKVRTGIEEASTRCNIAGSLLTALDDAFGTIIQRRRDVDPHQPSTIHRVRVALKQFRYMIEIVHSLLPGYPMGLLKKMDRYQTTIGTIQDLQVLLDTLADFADKHKNFDSQPIRHDYVKRQGKRINIYMRDINLFLTFWRNSPRKPFPWELSAKA